LHVRKMAEISIIIPVYNSEKYIEKCLRSIMAQTMRDIEILCIDDGSTDGSAAIMKKLSEIDPRIRIYGQKKSGPAAARNLGLVNASGKYLMFCDSDDTYNADMCETMHREITENDVDCVCCRAALVFEVDDAGYKKWQDDGYYDNFGLLGVYDTDNGKILMSVNVLLWSKIFKRDVVSRFGISFPAGYKCDDDAFFYQYYTVTRRIKFIDCVLYNYLQRENSIMSNIYAKRSRDYFDAVYATKYYYDFICRHGIADYKRSLLCMLKMLDSVKWYVNNFCDNDADREKVAALLNEFFPEKYLDCVNEKSLYRRSFLRLLSVEVIRKFNGRDFSFKKRLIVRIGGKKLFSVSKKIGIEEIIGGKNGER